MMIKLIIILIILQIVSFYTIFGKILLVQYLFRHGDRSPLYIYPTSPNGNAAWPTGLGQLTNIGIQQHFRLGLLMRERYDKDNILDNVFNPSKLKVYSDDYDRTLMSAYAHLAGLYYPANNSVRWNSKIPWIPIPVHTTPLKNETIIGFGKDCKRYDKFVAQFYNSPLVKSLEQQNQALFRYLQMNSGFYAPISFANMWELYDSLFCELAHNLTRPSFYTQQTEDNFTKLDHLDWSLLYKQSEVSRLQSGVFLDTVLGHIESFQMDQIRYRIFSGHDDNVAALLGTLNVSCDKHPPYTATVILELHQSDVGERFVRLFYHNSTFGVSSDQEFQLFHPLQLSNCPLDCPLADLLRLTADRRIKALNIDQECSLSNEELRGDESRLDLIGRPFLLAGLMTLVVLWTILVFKCLLGRNKPAESKDAFI